jgi:hypothetical protein
VIFWNRARTVFSWLVLLILLFCLIGGSLAMWELMNVAVYVKEMKKLAEERQIPPPVPTEAKETAKLFIGVWLSSADANDPGKKIASLKSYISSDFEQFLQANSNFLVQNPDQFKVYRADDFGERWVVPNHEARVRIRVITYDNRVFYFECPVRKSGSAWVVYQLPSLVAGPQKKNDDLQNSITLADDEKNSLQTTLNNFMGVWLKGEGEAVRRYTDGTGVPTANVLPGDYQGVKTILPLNKEGDVYMVRVWVGIQDSSHANLTLSYDVKVKKENNEWFILSVN